MSIPQRTEKTKIKFEKATRSDNVLNTREVRINKALFKSLSITAKKRDSSLKKIHSTAAKAINNLVKVADAIVTKGKGKGPRTFTEEEFKELHSNMVNGLGLVCQTSQRVNARRVRNSSNLSWLANIGSGLPGIQG
jgi:hypothetical protein